MQTKWYLILVLTVFFAASVISISFANEDADEDEEELADEDVSAQDQSIAPAGKPAPIACDPPCDEGWICKRGACIEDRKACDDGNPCTTGDRMVKGKCQGTPIADGIECTDDIGNTGECSNGQCVACEEWQQFCDGMCVNENDPNNCFACDNVCTGNEICDAPNYDPVTNPDPCIDCSTLGEGYTACTVGVDPVEVKTCIDTSSDPYNCGGCDNICDGPDCCSGTCTDTLIDENNCGECGITCADTESCVDGSCVESSTCSDPTPQVCTWYFNGVPDTVCCSASDTCAMGFGGDETWYNHAVCCPEDQLFNVNECCPEGTHPYTSVDGWTSCERDSCINGVLDPGEADVDCGGDADFGTGCYDRCANDLNCAVLGDQGCASGFCSGGICGPCTDYCHYSEQICTEGVCEWPV